MHNSLNPNYEEASNMMSEAVVQLNVLFNSQLIVSIGNFSEIFIAR
jgi:hypothetical protein